MRVFTLQMLAHELRFVLQSKAMTMELIIALSVFFLAVFVRVFAFPGEVALSIKRSLPYSYFLKLNLLTWLLHSAWVVYGAIKGDWIIILAQSLGLMSSIVLAGHMLWRYRKNG